MKALPLQLHFTRIIGFWLLVPLLVFCFAVYVYYVNAAIVNIVERKHTEAQSRVVAAHISELETQYYALRSDITSEHATELGFVESDATVFALRDVHSGIAKLAE
jgi:hypothetical protein